MFKIIFQIKSLQKCKSYRAAYKISIVLPDLNKEQQITPAATLYQQPHTWRKSWSNKISVVLPDLNFTKE
jgi:hypothetical protein